MTEHAIGFGVLLLVGILTVWIARRHRTIALPLLLAYGARSAAAVFHQYIAALPDGMADARAMEKIAWDWGRGGLDSALINFPGPDSHFYSWMLSLFYAFTGRSPLAAQALSVLAGLGSVYLTWRLATELWDERHARKAAWVVALFPTMILYSALTMREAYIVFFLLLGLIGVVRWVRNENLSSLSLVCLGFGIGLFFHGGMFIAILVFGLMFAKAHAEKCWNSFQRNRIRVSSMVLLLVIFAGVASFAEIGFKIPKLGSPGEMVDTGRLLHRFNYSNRGLASYPDWVVPTERSEIVWKAPIRIVYFLFSPFFWDLSKPSHLIGWMDSFLYVVIAFLAWRHRGAIWANPEARAVALILIALVLIFGVAVGNFGTGLRHRAKFVAVALALVAPRLPRLVSRRKAQSRPDLDAT